MTRLLVDRKHLTPHLESTFKPSRALSAPARPLARHRSTQEDRILLNFLMGPDSGYGPVTAPKAVEVHAAPVREPPAWRLNYRIGSGACGTVFLEKVQTRRMGFPELWAVKRIPRALPNFPIKRYQAEIKNLQALSAVSFSPTCVL